jgi:DNA-binding transcriptional MerR regulator
VKEITYNLRELGREADVTERTVRYYIKEGLLPPPQGSGPFSRYGYEHWLRLQFIKRLKDEYLPLSEIKNLLARRSTAELDELARQVGITPAGAAGDISAKGQAITSAQTSDPLRAFIDGGSGRTLLLREQMASWPTASNEAASYNLMPAFLASFKATPAPYIDLATGSAPDSFAGEADIGEDEETGEAAPEDEPEPPNPTFYPPPKAASRPYAPQSFMAGAPGAASGGSPTPPGAPGAANRPAPAPAPLRSMKMSRIAAPTREAAYDRPAESRAPMPPEQAPLPPPPAPMLSMMVAPMAAPGQAPGPPESKKEVETVTGQTWERIEVAPGVELHLEKSIADTHRPALANLLKTARRLFGPKEI